MRRNSRVACQSSGQRIKLEVSVDGRKTTSEGHFMSIVEEYLNWLGQIAGDGGRIFDIGINERPQLFVVVFD
jgi:hypothetical protein